MSTIWIQLVINCRDNAIVVKADGIRDVSHEWLVPEIRERIKRNLPIFKAVVIIGNDKVCLF